MALLCLGNGLTQFFPLAGRLNATATQTMLMGVFSSNWWCLHPYDVRHWLNSCDSYEKFVIIDILDSALYCHHKKTNWGNVFSKNVIHCSCRAPKIWTIILTHTDPGAVSAACGGPAPGKSHVTHLVGDVLSQSSTLFFLKLILCSCTYFLVIHLFFNVLGTELHASWFLWD